MFLKLFWRIFVEEDLVQYCGDDEQQSCDDLPISYEELRYDLEDDLYL